MKFDMKNPGILICKKSAIFFSNEEESVFTYGTGPSVLKLSESGAAFFYWSVQEK